MAIDINKLRNGETIKCSCCNKGILKPLYGTATEKASCFKCSECGEKLHINFSMKEKNNRP